MNCLTITIIEKIGMSFTIIITSFIHLELDCK